MGCFTWTLANKPVHYCKDGEISDSSKLMYGRPGWLYCPNGEKIYTPYYNGYGMFGQYDVYDLVVDWNRDHLRKIFSMLDEKDPGGFHTPLRRLAELYEDRDEAGTKAEIERLGQEEQPYLKDEWKRNLGIAIACDYNEDIPFPIKVVSVQNPRKSYAELPASISCQ